MKKYFIITFLIALALNVKAVERPCWIAPQGNTDTVSTWLCYQKTVDLKKVPRRAMTRISADSKYWLWINGEPVVIEGGVKRGPNPHDSYCDNIDLAPFLKKGENVVSVLVWHFGKHGFSHNSSGKAALFVDCPELPELDSNGSWHGLIHPAYYIPEGISPNYRLPESNIGFDARKDIDGWYSTVQQWPAVVCRGKENDAPWGRLKDRVIPLWKDFGAKSYAKVELRKGESVDTLIAKLPYNAQIMPGIELSAPAGCRIGIFSDNYYGGGEPNVRAEYITKDGSQKYESKGWINGELILYFFPKEVKVNAVTFRETGYDTEMSGKFECDDDFFNRLWNKAARTLFITMRDTYMDCPDRERAQWWGDEVNESGEAFYALTPSSHALMKKGMYELIGWQRPDGSIFAPVPAGNWDSELPGQMLASIGYYGFWNYYLNTGDLATIADLYPGVKRYMKLWERAADGTMCDRKGGWHWGDWGDNIDKTALYNAWYYIAQKGEMHMAEALGLTHEADSIRNEMKSLKEAFNRVFWKGDHYRHPAYTGDTDDRVQALAVVGGLADADKYPVLLECLKTHEHASPYTEKYVMEALFKMGYPQEGLNRMKRRFGPMVDNPDFTTLFEGWGIGAEGYGGGTTNHAWSGGGLTILSQYVAGVSPIEPGYKVFRIAPALAGLSYAKAVVPTVNGDIAVSSKRNGDKMTIKFNIPKGTAAVVDIPESARNLTVNGKKRESADLHLDKAGKYTVIYSLPLWQ